MNNAFNNAFNNKERGATLILVAALMFSLLGLTAFAVDIGYYFVIKNRLQNAVDAAALAGVDTVYRSTNLVNFPANFTANAQTAANNALSLDGFPSTDPNIVGTPTIEVGWWDTDPNIVPSGYYHYPAVQVSMTYNASVFFAKLFNIQNIGAQVTATAVTAIPGNIHPILPFAISYCSIVDGWNPPSGGNPGGPKSPGVPFSISSAYSPGSFDPAIDCIASQITGTVASGSKTLIVTNTVPSADFKKLAVGTALKDSLGLFKNNTTITGIVTGGTTCTTLTCICTSLPCTYQISAAPTAAITSSDVISADSGALANWTPLIWSSSGIGASTLNSYIPTATGPSPTTPPGVNIGQEIRIQTGTTASLFQAVRDCYANGTGTCVKVALPVVNGLPCPAPDTSHQCPAASASDPNFPLTGVSIAPNGILTDSNMPIIGFACVRLTDVLATTSNKHVSATLDTGCVINGTGGGSVYFGVLLPPVLVH